MRSRVARYKAVENRFLSLLNGMKVSMNPSPTAAEIFLHKMTQLPLVCVRNVGNTKDDVFKLFFFVKLTVPNPTIENLLSWIKKFLFC